MDWLFIGGVVLFVIILMATIAVHEAGHMVAAKALKLDVPEYSIGFGPRLLTKKTAKTNYNLRAIPIGGFVMIQDRRFPEKSYERDALSRVSPWKRQVVFSAGPLVNIIIGMTLLLGLLMWTPYHEPSNHVGQLHSCDSAYGCAAAEIGLQEGDEIIAVDGQTVTKFEDLAVVKAGKTSLEEIVVLRNGEEVVLNDLKLYTDPETQATYMGIQATVDKYRTLPEAWTFVADAIERNFIALVHLPEKIPVVIDNVVTGDKGAEDPASVVAAGKGYGDLASNAEVKDDDKAFTFMFWAAFLNIAIGMINLAPILPLDGGRMWIAFCDSMRMIWARIRKKEYEPVTQRMFTAMASVSAVVVFALMGLIIASDISAIFAGSI